MAITMTVAVIAIVLVVMVAAIFRFYISSSKKVTRITQLYIHPIKSCRGVSVQEAVTDELGFVDDRRYCLINTTTNKYVTLRENPALGRLQPSIGSNSLVIHADNMTLPFEIVTSVDDEWWDITNTANGWEKVQIGRTSGYGRAVGGDALTQWLQQAIGGPPLRLMRLHRSLRHARDQSQDPKWKDLFPSTYSTSPFTNSELGPLPQLTGWHDGSPFLVVRSESLQELNRHLKTPVSVGRFRANIITTGGGDAWAEDHWTSIKITPSPAASSHPDHKGDEIILQTMKPCGRCITLLADPNGGGASRDGEPLITLRRLRHVTKVMPSSSPANKQTYGDTPLFGVNMRHIARARTVIRVGDIITINPITS